MKLDLGRVVDEYDLSFKRSKGPIKKSVKKVKYWGQKVGVAARVAADSWMDSPSSTLWNLLSDTKNPYIARMLVSIEIKNRAGLTDMSLNEAASLIEDKKQVGAIKVWNSLEAAIVEGNGGSRGMWQGGQTAALLEMGLEFPLLYGVSIGSVPSSIHGLAQNGYLKDLTPERVIEDTNRLGEAFKKDLKANIFSKGFNALLKDHVILPSAFRGVVKQLFGNYMLKDAGKISHYTGDVKEKKLLKHSSLDGYADRRLDDSIVYSSTIPFLMGHYNGKIDGASFALQLQDPLVDGADIVAVSLLNNHPSNGEDGKKSMWGIKRKYKMIDDIVSMRQYHDNQDKIYVLTRADRETILEHGDPKGRFMFFAPNLSHIVPERFDDEVWNLPELGYNQTRSAIARALDPKRVHPDYSPQEFRKQYAGKKAKLLA